MTGTNISKKFRFLQQYCIPTSHLEKTLCEHATRMGKEQTVFNTPLLDTVISLFADATAKAQSGHKTALGFVWE